jgi:hypothetical protein
MTCLTPQTRAIRQLEAEGYAVDVVEQINRWGPITKRKDLFGGFDLLAVNDAGDVKAIQVTSRTNVAARVAKITELPILASLRRAGWSLEVWGWGPTKTMGDWKRVDLS